VPAFYNEFDPKAAAWLRELITDGLIAPGVVNETDMRELKTTDLSGFSQLHFCAGIGGWSYALRLAGWADDVRVWTASLPCQPFSAAGKRKGTDDERHLWPVLSALIRECRPDCIFGEQVAGRDGYEWLDGVRADLESQGYAVGAADLAAAGVGAPHIRQRLFWVAHAAGRRRQQRARKPRVYRAASETTNAVPKSCDNGDNSTRRLADPDGRLAGDGGLQPGGEHGQQPQDDGTAERMGHAPSGGRRVGGHETQQGSGGHPFGSGWAASIAIPCADGKWRRVPGGPDGPEPALFPLAHGIPGRVGMLRGAGNAIVPRLAAAFVHAYLETEREGILSHG
jgi:DNA (cytosine-5)-methyltransferase 1